MVLWSALSLSDPWEPGIGQVVGQRCRHVDLPPVPAAHVASAVLNEQNLRSENLRI